MATINTIVIVPSLGLALSERLTATRFSILRIFQDIYFILHITDESGSGHYVALALSAESLLETHSPMELCFKIIISYDKICL